MIKVMLLLLMVSIFTGCANKIRTTTTTFYAAEHQQRGAIIVLSSDHQTNNSLAFKHYQAKFNEKLKAQGYAIAPSIEASDYIALVSYGIDNGKSSIVSTPIVGQIGGDTRYRSGTAYIDGKKTTYSGFYYTMPVYGVVGSSTRTVTTYTRAIAMDIVKTDSFKSKNPDKMYEVRAKSVGNCSVMLEVFDEMLEAMFSNFPNESGKAITIAVESDSRC
jgi:hypothetical protein